MATNSKQTTAADAVSSIVDGSVIAVNSSSGLCCPDAVLKALGERFEQSSNPSNLTMIHPIAAGDMFGTKGVDHLAKPGMIETIIGGSYPSGPSSAEPPLIWQLDMLREAAGQRPGVLTKVGLETFVDPRLEGCAMNQRASERAIVRTMEFEGEEWLYFPVIKPDVAIIRASTADERGNLTFEHEGAYLWLIKSLSHQTSYKQPQPNLTRPFQVKRFARSTVLKHHRLTLQKLSLGVLLWNCSLAGQSTSALASLPMCRVYF